VSGFDERLDAVVALQASVNPGLSGHTYRISYNFAGGNFNQASFGADQNSGYMYADFYNVRTSNGSNQKTGQYDFYVDVVLNGQVISGAATQRTYHTITPGNVGGIGDISLIRQINSGSVTVSFYFNPDGSVNLNGGVSSVQYWMSPSDPGQAANFDISLDNGASWAQLNAQRGMSVSATGTPSNPKDTIRSGVYKIRNRNTLTQVGQGNWYLEAIVGTPA